MNAPKFMQKLTTLSLTVAAAAILWLALSAGSTPTTQAQTADTPTPEATVAQEDEQGVENLPTIEGKPNPPRYPNLDSHLNRIVEQVRTGQFTAQAAAANAPIHREESVAVTLYVTEGYAQDVWGWLEESGASPRNMGIDYIEAYVPVSLLPISSEREGVISIRTIIPPQPAQGVVVSEGFWVHGVSSWRRAGYRGQGVKIGIIDAGFGGFDSLMGTELPSNVQARCYIEVGVFTSDLADCETGSHGTAVTEAVFDIAPEATYYISNALASGDLAKTAVDWMVEEGVDIINMSLGFSWDGRGDGTFYSSNSPLRSVDIAVANGTTWANAAGNDALGTWFGSFTDSDGDGFHEFSGTDECNEIQDGGYLFQLRWDDQWGGATIDLDLYLYDLDNDVHIGPLISSNDVQSGAVGDIPYETLEEVYGYGTYCLAVKHHGGDIPDWIQLTGWHAELEHHTSFGSIGNPAESASPGLLAVGAAPSYDIFTIEDFSSRGPTTDGRLKPEIVGADESASAVWGHWSGTSQASPHVAGLAALVKQRFPEYSPAQIADYLKEHSEERGVPGPDNTWGYGFAKLPALDETPSVFIDRDALVAFYNATNGDNWTDNTDWLTDAHIYGWYGVTVDIDGSVTRLTLEENNLAGEMPAELGDLSGLTRLNLWNNQLTGEIPTELSNLNQLRTLDISRNQLEGEIPAELGNLSNLEHLWLDRNQLTGEIPAELSSLTHLTVLHIAENQIEGEIPAWIGDLSDLEELYLQDNRLTGSIPAELADLANLEVLLLAGNQLTGCIPEELRDIPYNDFDELGLPFCDDVQIPPDPCVEQLTGDGVVDGSWETGSECVSENRDGDGTGAYARYYTFTLTEESELTVTLESTEDTYLYLLDGIGRDGERVAENDDIDAGGDNYNSRIEGTFEPGDYTIEATTYEAEVSGTFTLTVEGLGDSVIPPVPSSDREVLVALYNATNGPEWNDNDNWLSRADIGEWWGVTTDEYGRVIELKLSGNNLEGEIPSSLGELSGLTELDLFDNGLTGDIPSELSNLTRLRTLDIGWNQLTGPIPAELGSLSNLEELWLDRNQLTGEIPAELSNLTNLTVFNIAENQIEGEIPAWLGDLSDLEELYLQHNQLTGSIPAELADLADLEELFLADNQLTGCIPEELRDITDNDFGELGLPFCDDIQVPTDPCIERLTGDGIVNGSWNTGSKCVSESRDGDGTGAYARYYTFTLTEQSDLTITLESTVDPYLYLLEGVGRDGKQVAENDDIDRDGGDYNSLIEETFEPGDYTIEATTYEAEATGDFILTVAGIDFAEQRDRAGLVALYNSTDGANWHRNDNWLTDAPLDDWYGVDTNNGGRVIELELYSNRLTGGLPAELGNLTALEVLDLEENQLTGLIPSELGNLTNLWLLNLGENQLTGRIPSELRNLTNLYGLYLNDNRLTGEIPPELGNLITLEELWLNGNQLTGHIPSELGNLTNLTELFLSGNQLIGCVPVSLQEALEDFDELDLPFCSESQSAFDECAETLSDLPYKYSGIGVENMWSSDCVSTNRPGSYARFFTLTLHHPFDVTIALTSEQDTYLYLMGGIGADGLVLQENGDYEGTNSSIQAPLHPGNYTIEATTNDTGATGAFYLEVDVDDWDPIPPPTALTDRAALTALYHAANGDDWHHSDNWLTDAPLSEWKGVRTDDSGRVIRLDLEANSLSGELPLEFGNLDQLEWVNISHNQLTGELSRSLTNLSMLEYFYFDNNAGLCAPGYDAFQEWAQSLEDFRGDACPPPPADPVRDTLTTLYYATGGDDWRNNVGWLTAAPLGDWHGVTTDSDGRVVELNLEDNNLSGHIPSQLGIFTDLTELSLGGNQLSGEIPPELGNLTNLEDLWLSGNNLSGEIPAELGNMTELRHLILDHNELTGGIPAELGDMIYLEELRINDNQFMGRIPARLGNLINLRYLDLSHNELTGGIPSELGNLTELIWLDLHTNPLGGEIPSELSNLPSMEWLNLTDNGLTGRIPPELGNLPSLWRLSLGGNELTGEIPPELANIEALTRLQLWGNDLAAQAFLPRLNEMAQLTHIGIGGNPHIDGADVLSHAAALPNLRYLELNDARITTDDLVPHLNDLARIETLSVSGNLLTGDHLLSIIAEFENLRILSVSNNQLTGEIPTEWDNPFGPRRLYLNANHLTGAIPAELGNFSSMDYLYLNDNRLTGEVPAELGSLDFLYELRLNDNRLTGTLPQTLTQLEHINEITFHNNAGLCAPADAAFQEWLQSIDDVQGPTCGLPIESPDRSALVALYHATDGDNWDSSDNWLSAAPLHEWYGVETDDGGHVTRLELRYNNIAGEIPSEIGSLSNLTSLDLSGNELTGTVPHWLDNLANLETLDLTANTFSGNIPSDLAKLGNLKSLRLGFNDLTGEIPPELGSLANLILLYLAVNNLSGEIPAELAKLSNLKSMSLGTNELTGRIPSELGNLTNLEGLGLNNNNLSGTIPPELAKLSNLKNLSLRRNGLTGEIPPWIGDLSNLESLSLHVNNFTGEIPTELANLTKLEYLHLYHNYLSGEIPPELANLTELQALSLSYNYLTGEIPAELGNFARLEGLELNGNNLTGEVPSELGNLTELEELRLSNNLLTGALPHSLMELTELDEFAFHHNAGLCAPTDESFQNWLQDIDDFEGGATCGVPIPPSHESDIAALTALYNATNGDNLKRNRNWLSDAPVSEWYGVTADTDGRVVRLGLYDNNLSGTIPSELANLSNLTSLSLSENELTGEFPPELTKLTNLTFLYFYDNAGLCAPADAAFQNWLQAVINVSGPTCDAPPPYPERTWAINRSLTIGDFTMRLHQITDTADGLKVDYSYETDLSKLDHLPNDNAAIRYPDGSIHDSYMARLPEEDEVIDVSLGGFIVFDSELSGNVDIPLASVSDDGALNPQPELSAGDRRYGVTKLIYFEENEQLTIMIQPLNEAAKYRVLGFGSGLDESTDVNLTDDFGITSEWVSGSSAFDPFEQTLDFQTFDFLAVLPERFASVTKLMLTVKGGGNIVAPFVFEDLRLAPEDAMPKPPTE